MPTQLNASRPCRGSPGEVAAATDELIVTGPDARSAMTASPCACESENAGMLSPTVAVNVPVVLL